MGPASANDLLDDIDQRVVMRNMPWSHYEVMLALRGESSVPRISYLKGVIELMTPSRGHEGTKSALGRLVLAYAEERGRDIWAFGSWTLKDARQERGGEPDECYVLAQPETKTVPDLVIEVAWTRGGIDKLEIYRGLHVPEVWFWEKGRIEVFVLKGDTYESTSRSAAFPDLDLGLVARLATHPNQSQAVRDLRASVRKSSQG